MKFILYNDLRNNLILCMFYEVLGCVIALVGVPALVAAQRCIVWVCLKLWSWRYRLTGHYGLFNQVN